MSLNYCPHCGTGLEPSVCRSCGTAMFADWSFCGECGTPYENDGGEDEYVEELGDLGYEEMENSDPDLEDEELIPLPSKSSPPRKKITNPTYRMGLQLRNKYKEQSEMTCIIDRSMGNMCRIRFTDGSCLLVPRDGLEEVHE